jgi:threonine/homoserine/homoserine lactone efflux protein
MAIFQGFVLGLIISILVGPVFLLLINTSLRYGFRAAMVLELGIISSDVSYILLAWLGLGQFMLNPTFQYWMGLGGGVLILSYAVSVLTSQKNPLEKEPEPMTASNAFGLVVKGFLLNSSNPSVIIFWFTTVGLAMKTYNGDSTSIFSYFSATILTATGIDMLKAHYAKKSRELINPRSYRYFKWISGGLLLIIGTLLLGKSLFSV